MSNSESESGSEVEILTEESSCSTKSSSVAANKSSSESSVSLLDRHRSPEPSVLSRKRKMRQNLPPTGRKRGKCRVVANPKGITPAERVRAYPNEHFNVNSNKKLFCWWRPRRVSSTYMSNHRSMYGVRRGWLKRLRES